MAIFTPGTLTVQLSTQPNSTIIHRPISSLNYSAVRQFSQLGIRGGYSFIGPSSEISRLVATVAAQGSMINPPAPYTNCSYNLEFYGPSLSCGSAVYINNTRVAEIINPQSGDARPFVSFVPMSNTNNNETDLTLAGLQYTILNEGSGVSLEETLDMSSKDHGRIYTVINEGFGANFAASANKTIECGLYNTSYSVVFAFSNGQPKLTVVNATRLSGVINQGTFRECDATGFMKRSEEPVCSPDVVAYTALFNAFGQQLVGFLAQSHYGYILSSRTQVSKTVFMDTKELYATQYYMNHGKSPDTRPDDAIGMAQALEEVFTNATLSLFSSSSFLYVSTTWHSVTAFRYNTWNQLTGPVNRQNETAAAIVPVTVLTPQNAFVYRPRNLLISYISGVIATAICVVVGFVCISKASSEAFSTSFSTIMRTTRNPELDRLLPPAETSGAEPLSKKLARIKLRLLRGKKPPSQAQCEEGGDVDTETTSDDEWTCFAVPEDGHDLESAPYGEMSRKAKPPASDVDVDSLLMPGET